MRQVPDFTARNLVAQELNMVLRGQVGSLNAVSVLGKCYSILRAMW